MQLSAVPETGILKVLFMSSVNYSFKQKLIGLLNFHDRSTLIFCFVMPMFKPYGKLSLTPMLATSSIN